MKKPKGFFTYYQHAQVIDEFSDSDAGKLYKALLRYGLTGELTDFSGDKAIQLVFRILKADVDENCRRYQTVCENRQKAALERERRRTGETGAEQEHNFHNCDNCN